MRNLRLATYGIQGFIGEGLTPDLVVDFAAAFGTFCEGGRLLVGRDTRRSSHMLHDAVVAGLLSTGCDVLDFGICPAPMLQHAPTRHGAVGAVSISGGHNPMGSNAVVLISSKGSYIEPIGGGNVLDIYHATEFRAGSGAVSDSAEFAEPYFDALAERLDIASIRKAGFTVVVDPVNGSGCRFLKPFADRLSFKLLPINSEESGYLGREPEPRPRSAQQAASLIEHVGADVGFVLSSDMGRLSIVSETGETASEEYTFPLIANHVLASSPGVVVTNCCTTRMVEAIAEQHGVQVVKSRVGQAHIMSALADESAVIGGEGNGSVALPSFSWAFDGFLMMGLILEAIAQSGSKTSELLRALPQYHIVKQQIYGEPHRCYRAIERLALDEDWRSDGTLSTTDGVRVDWDDGWIHLRASQTEPKVRIISESSSRQEAETRAMNASRILEQEL